jgi:ABC-type multidrug transport system fused ATPase/permease subunit
MEYTNKRAFQFFVQFFKPYKWQFFFATLFAAAGSAIWLYNAYAFSQVVDFVVKYTAGQSLQPLYTIFVIWVMAIIVRYSFGFLSRWFGINSAEKAAINAETTAIKHLSQLDISWHEKENTGNKMKRIDRGARTIVELTRIWLSTVVDMVINFVGTLVIIATIDRLIAALLLPYIVIYYLISRYTRGKGVQALKEVNLKDEEVTGLWYEVVSNIRSIKVLGMGSKILEYVQVPITDMLGKIRRRIFWFQLGGMLLQMWEGLVRVSFIGFIIWNIFQGRYEVGFLVLFYGYFNTITNSIGRLSEVAQNIAEARANIGRITDILDEPINIDREEGKTEFPKTWDGLHLNNVSFTYGENAALSNISFSIKKGEKVGIVGLSGAGKSTLFKLLLKEYENYDGDILVGQTSLKSIKKSSYVQHIAAVLQETEVFNMSLKQNITLANSAEAENQELFDRALDIAHIKDFLPKLKEGVETKIGEKGVKLSGGEKQRLGIARAVFKQPEILFLDEATSHLDVESEQKIQDTLAKFFKNVTAVVIAHRLSTIKEMDRIIVIEGGKIIETGTFDELYKSDGRFREFWDKQKG